MQHKIYSAISDWVVNFSLIRSFTLADLNHFALLSACFERSNAIVTQCFIDNNEAFQKLFNDADFYKTVQARRQKRCTRC